MRHRGYNSGSEWTPERISALSRDVAIVLGGGIVLGLFAAAARSYYVVAVVALAALVTIVAWRFEIAVLVYTLVAFIPWGQTPDLATGGSGVGRGLYVSQILLGFLLTVWVIKYLFLALPRDRVRSGFHAPIVLYLAYSVLNVVNSFVFWDMHVNKQNQHLSVNAVELGLRVLSAGAFIMLATTVQNAKWLKWVTVAAMVPGLYNVLNTLAGGIIPLAGERWQFMAILPVCYAWAIVMGPEHCLWKRALGLGVTLLGLYVTTIMCVAWVSGWLGMLTALGAVTIIKSRKAFAVLSLVLCIAAALAWPTIDKLVIGESKQGGDYDRFSLLQASWKYATKFPLGVGIGNYRAYNSFHYGEEWGTTTYTSAHGTYAQHLSEMGIPGTAIFIAILVGGLVWMLGEYHKLPPGTSRTYLLATCGQLVGAGIGSTIGDYIIPTYHNGGLVTFSGSVYCWIFWGLAVAHVRISRAEAAAREADSAPEQAPNAESARVALPVS